MNSNKKIRVVQWGLGAMGRGMAQLITTKEGLELVGAIDVNPALDGKDVGEVLGVDPLDVKVTTDPSSILDSSKVDVVTIATTSWVKNQIDDLSTILSAGVNVVSIAEEMSAPEAQNPELAEKLDDLAKANGVSIVGVGVNPGFVLDHLVVALTSGSQQVTKVEARRVNDLAPYGETVLRTQGVGTTPEEFEAGVADGSIVRTRRLPRVGTPHQRRPGTGSGLRRTTRGADHRQGGPSGPRSRHRTRTSGWLQPHRRGPPRRRGGHQTHPPQQVDPGAEGTETGDYITISGVPEISMCIQPEIAGGKATAGICVNTIPRIFAATPGLKRVIDLPSPSALMGPSAYERR